MSRKIKVAVIGLGYVGLPLSLLLSKKIEVLGFDLNRKKINNFINSIDVNKEVTTAMFKNAKYIKFSSQEKNLKKYDIFIIAVPTPVNKKNKPDLRNLLSATKLVAKYVKNQSIVILESTVYPGTTEKICAPLIEKISNLKYLNSENSSIMNEGFYCGFCPERINPGDSKHTINKITKVISGSTKQAVEKIKKIYQIINGKNIFIAPSIQVAEAAKIIENTQRDVNIALVNEFSKIFNLMNIDTNDVLETAKTKWNFLNFKPGLVGGHCIGVDPYYLTFRSKQLKYTPEVILSGRKINDGMAKYISDKLIFFYKKKKINDQKKCLIVGISFKENVTDIRNSKTLELIKILKINNFHIDIFDPIINEKKILNLKVYKNLNDIESDYYNSLIIAVPHFSILKLIKKNIFKKIRKQSVVFDLKGIFDKKLSDFRL